jgi:hypothetical protein
MYGITAICEPAVSVCCGNGRQRLLDRQLQCLPGAGLGSTQEGLELRSGLLNGREIRRVWRQVEQLCPALLNELTDSRHFTRAQVGVPVASVQETTIRGLTVGIMEENEVFCRRKPQTFSTFTVEFNSQFWFCSSPSVMCVAPREAVRKVSIEI